MGKYSSNPSQRARELVAAGKLGGAKYGRMGGRPRTPRASEIAAREAQEHAEEIVAAFRDALHPSQPIMVRIRAAVAWLNLERKEDARVNASMSSFALASREELVALIMGYVNSAPREDPIASPGQITEESGC
jgi:hypothetical protein